MLLIIIIIIALITSAWLCYEMYRKPIIDDKENINDPTDTCWHDDDDNYHPDTKI
jgi:uncharacterized protein YpmB